MIISFSQAIDCLYGYELYKEVYFKGEPSPAGVRVKLYERLYPISYLISEKLREMSKSG